MFGHADWSHRGDYIIEKHGVTAEVANDAIEDPERVVIDPDYNSTSGRSARIIGFSQIVDDLITVIVLEEESGAYGVNAWRPNARDGQIYKEGELG